MSNTSSIANRYIQAIFASMQSGSTKGDLIAEMASFLDIIDNNVLAQRVFFNRVVPIRIKRQIADNILNSEKFSSTTKNFISILIANGRLHYLHEILQGLISVQTKKDGFTEITFETGTELPVEDKSSVDTELATMLSCKPKTTFAHNTNMLGGFKLYFDSKMIDKSFKSKLNRIQKMLQSTELNIVDKAEINNSN